MAPKKGGSSSSSSSSGSSSSGSRSGGSSSSSSFFSSTSCDSLSGFTGTYYISLFVIEGLCVIILCVTALLWLFFSLRKRKTAPSPVQRVLRFYTYAPLLLFLILAKLLTILDASLDLCNVTTRYTSNSIFVAYNLLGGLAEILLLAIISIIFVRYLLKTKARSTRLATIINSVVFAIVAVLWLPLYVLYSYISVGHLVRRGLRLSTYKLSAAYDFLYLVAAITASVFIISAVVPSSVPAFTTKCKVLTIFTLLMFCIYPLVGFIRDAGYSAAGRSLSIGAYVAFEVFQAFPFTFAVLGLLLAVHSAKPSGAVTSATNHDGKIYAFEQNPHQAPQQPVHQQQAYQQPQQQQQQPIYQNHGVYTQGAGYGGSSMVFYNPPTAPTHHL